MNPAKLTGPPMRLRLGGTLLPMVGQVRMYVCGITPYDVTHLGHAATYVWADAAERVLRWHGHTVTVARNVTDVDDVLFAEARRRGESHTMLATLQRASFEAHDGDAAGAPARPTRPAPRSTSGTSSSSPRPCSTAARPTSATARSTRGRPTPTRTSVSTAPTALERAAEFHDDPDDPDKDDPLDIVVWQAGVPDDESAGRARGATAVPGWHAECAAMVLALFGSSVDLHCGGADLDYPHHACEAALAEAATGVDPVRARLAARRPGVDRRRQDGEVDRQPGAGRGPAAEHSPGAVRLLCLNRPWAQPWEYTPRRSTTPRRSLEQLYAAAARPGSGAGAAAVPAALLDDLDVPARWASPSRTAGRPPAPSSSCSRCPDRGATVSDTPGSAADASGGAGPQGARRRSRRRATAGQGPPRAPRPEAAAEPAAPDTAPTTPAPATTQSGGKPRRTQRSAAAAGRGERDLAGPGSSQVGPTGAMRARDLNRPTDEDLAEAEQQLVIVRRGWSPEADANRQTAPPPQGRRRGR